MAKSKRFFQNLVKLFTALARKDKNEADLEKIAVQAYKQFSFETLSKATNNFHPDQKLGEGGFGPVFKGKLADGRVIAVKKLSQRSSQGKKEFENEANLLALVQHRNVVNLLGHCVKGEEKLLVYEYVANESLDKLLIKSRGREVLDWDRRRDMITGIAKGLLYLHEDAHCCIIHRDIKASNILLDEKWEPKIADFGLARLYPEDQTHINTRVAGTNGYMAPEYLMHGNLSVKADVFSFGVVVLELISGQKNSTFNGDPDSQSLLEWAYKLYKKNRISKIVDPTLAPSSDRDQISMFIQIGLLCTQSDPQIRPDMRRVVILLSRKPTVLDDPLRPGYTESRYRKPSSSKTGSSGDSNSKSFGSTTGSQTVTATASSTSRVKLDSKKGKQPMQNSLLSVSSVSMAAEEQQSFNPQFAAQAQAQAQAQPPTQVFPTLPQYPEMILTAIEELNEKNGSNKTSISKHIESTYGNLPAAYSTLLTHHLNRMKSSGQLVFFKNNYLKPDPNSPPRRGRGRPPKPKAPLPPGTVLPPPRPRGRPPKSRDPSDPPPPPKQRPASATTSVSGRKRGRPPKASAEQLPTDTPAPSTTGGEPRARGRPPKAAAEPVTTDISALSTTGGEPRGRGRPPKVKTAVAASVGA